MQGQPKVVLTSPFLKKSLSHKPFSLNMQQGHQGKGEHTYSTLRVLQGSCEGGVVGTAGRAETSFAS